MASFVDQRARGGKLLRTESQKGLAARAAACSYSRVLRVCEAGVTGQPIRSPMSLSRVHVHAAALAVTSVDAW
jgi:hypothetical protein